jgi:hypothetical protein
MHTRVKEVGNRAGAQGRDRGSITRSRQYGEGAEEGERGKYAEEKRKATGGKSATETGAKGQQPG